MDRRQTIPWLASTIVVVAALYAVLVLVLEPYRRFPALRSAAFTATTDAALIVLWIQATGGASSPFFVLWYISLGAVAFRFGARTTQLVAVAYAALDLSILAAHGALTAQPASSLVRVGYIFLTGLLGGYQSRETFAQTQAKQAMQRLVHEAEETHAVLRQRETQLQENVALLRATLDATADGILVVNSENRIVSHNERFATMWRIPPDVLRNGDDEEAMRSVLGQLKDPDPFLRRIRDLYQDPMAVSMDELEFHDGRVYERYSRPHLVQGRPAGRVWSFRDITERRRAEHERLANVERAKEVERLQAMDRFKTQFVNNVAHELWTPLTPIQLQLHMLQHGPNRLSDPQQASLRVIGRNMERLIHLVSELLDSARLQAGRFQVQRRPTNLHDVVSEIVQFSTAIAEQRGIRLEAQLDPLLPVNADPDRIVQVLHNLFSNAFKFTPKGGRVRIDSFRADSQVHVRITDTGVGMEPHQVDRLFGPFTQVHDPMKTTQVGSGLGLYISRAIMDAHQGSLTATSPGPNQGATFELTLPLLTSLPRVDVPQAAPAAPTPEPLARTQ